MPLRKAVAFRICRAGSLSLGLGAAPFPGVALHLSLQPSRCRRCGYSASSGRGNMSSTSGASASGGGGVDVELQADGRISEQKKAMRKQVKLGLREMTGEAVDAASAAVAERLLACPQLQQVADEGQQAGVSVYLSMPGELGTAAIISELFKRGKKVYIPKVMGPASADMRMFPLRSLEEVASFPLTKWKIPEPPEDLVLSREDGVIEGDIGVVVAPGLAFDSGCNRLGHGRGYYDCFFERVSKASKEKGRPPPVAMGVCFDQQVVECVPTVASDVRLDFVLTPTRTFKREQEVEGSGV